MSVERILPFLPLERRRVFLRRMRAWRRCTREAGLARRLRIVELYVMGWSTGRIAAALGCAPATAVRTLHRFRDGGEAGLLDGRRDNGMRKVDDDVRQALAECLGRTPEHFNWSRPTWTQELLVQEVERRTGIALSVTTISRTLAKLGARWGMARPFVACPWSRARKQRRLREIRRTLRDIGPRDVAFYEDEVDIHLNPKIGRDWMLRGQQRRILTPGKNEKRYLAGALAADGTELVVVQGARKTAALFLQLLEELHRRHPHARRIHVVLDNYVIHKTRKVQAYLAREGRLFNLLFLPPYCPDDNRIERLWRELHANVTRNHRCHTINQLMGRVRSYLAADRRRRRRSRPAPATACQHAA